MHGNGTRPKTGAIQTVAIENNEYTTRNEIKRFLKQMAISQAIPPICVKIVKVKNIKACIEILIIGLGNIHVAKLQKRQICYV